MSILVVVVDQMSKIQLLLDWEEGVATNKLEWITHTVYVNGVAVTLRGRHVVDVESEPDQGGAVYHSSLYRMRDGRYIGRRDYVVQDKEGYRTQWRCLCVDEGEVIRFFGTGDLAIRLFKLAGIDHKAVIRNMINPPGSVLEGLVEGRSGKSQ